VSKAARARARAARRIASTASGFAIDQRICRAKSSGSSRRASRPCTRSVTKDGTPPTWEASTQAPAVIASVRITGDMFSHCSGTVTSQASRAPSKSGTAATLMRSVFLLAFAM